MTSPPQRAPAVRAGLDALLRDLGPRIGSGSSLPAPPVERLPSGLSELDQLLGGGFPLGQVSEIAGPASCGRTSLLLALLAHVTGAGHFAAVVDAVDAFDPPSASRAGVDLSRVLWVRPGSSEAALRCTEPVLRAGGFRLVALDLVDDGHSAVPTSAWPRLRKATRGAGAALLLLSRTRRAGTFADLAVEMGAAHPRFAAAPDWLEALDGRVLVVRNRMGPGDRTAPVRFRAAQRAA